MQTSYNLFLFYNNLNNHTYCIKNYITKLSNFFFIHPVLIICQVFAIAYSSSYDTRNYEKILATNTKFLESLENVHPEMMRKPKLHTLLHLVDDMSDFGPAVGFNTERSD